MSQKEDHVSITFDFIWIPPNLGGHRGDPYEGMRTEIRWQRYISEFLKDARGIQWEEFKYNPVDGLGRAKARFTSSNPLPTEWLGEGAEIELLNGSKVLAIGVIRNCNSNT